MYHKPALLHETIEQLAIRPGGTYVDLTFGGGGHSAAILDKLEDGRLLVFDQDSDARSNIPSDSRITFVAENFRFFTNFLKYHNAYPLDGILADLGISSHQIDAAERGFSTRQNGPLDMRMNQNYGISAKELISTIDAGALTHLLKTYGEVHNAARLAAVIISSRDASAIETTEQLAGICSPLAHKGKENQYLAKVFQAFRIEVNQEIEVLEEMLLQLPKALKPGGRVAIITYHSLEDRPVKFFLKSGRLDGKVVKDFFGNELSPFRLITRKAMQATPAECNENPRVRSAKLRVAERIKDKEDEQRD